MDPVTRIIEATNGSDIKARVEATNRRVALTDAQRQLVLAAALSGDGSRLLEEVNHLRVLAYYDGRADGQSEGYGVGLEAGLTESRRLVADLANKFCDTGDGVPLAIIGPGGDFNREVKP